MLPGGHLKLPAVPRAGNDVTSKRSLSQRTACVWADTVEYVEGAIHVIDGEDPAIGNNFPAGADRDFSGVDERNPGHVCEVLCGELQLVSTEGAVKFSEVFRGDDVFKCAAGGFQSCSDVEVDFFVFVFVAVEERVEGLDVSLPE